MGKIIKKITLLILNHLIILLLVNGCSNLEETNLKNITIDNLSIGSTNEEIDFTKYTITNDYYGNYTYFFDEIIINLNDKIIDYLCSYFIENKTTISINENT